jgi:lycopene beta-cyclase
MHDLILVGGGLANGLLAYRLRQCRPELRVLLVEQDRRLGGNHTWSFFGTDLTPAQQRWIAPFVEHTWPFYEVAFPNHRRRIDTIYASFTSDRFHCVLSESLGDAVRLGASVTAIDGAGITLAGGERLDAGGVIDGRGYRPCASLVLGFQKFTGQVVELAENHDLQGPIIMDATIAQQGNFRFFYVLPLSRRRLLIEDTRYSDRPNLDPQGDVDEIAGYAHSRGWRIQRVLRRETGVLPVALAGDVASLWADSGDVALSGMRAGLFHATTGYSLPDAVRVADLLGTLQHLDSASLRATVSSYAGGHWLRQRFYRLLNRMLFRAADPGERYRVFERFYRLPQGLIERFYAGRLTRYDQLRILTGKPPVPFFRALKVVRESSVAGG